MPLIMCPNDNAAMQTIDRGEVQFDMCPTCRGVWLDRGELERLLAAGREETRGDLISDRNAGPTYRDTPRHDDHVGRGGHGYRHGRRSRSIFDIFD